MKSIRYNNQQSSDQLFCIIVLGGIIMANRKKAKQAIPQWRFGCSSLKMNLERVEKFARPMRQLGACFKPETKTPTDS